MFYSFFEINCKHFVSFQPILKFYFDFTLTPTYINDRNKMEIIETNKNLGFGAKPPAQHSPKHILNVLNDDCIKEILRKLENRKDFFNAAKSCTRFQYVAQDWFSHKTIQIGGKYRKSVIFARAPTLVFSRQLHSEDELNEFLLDLFTYLSIFGECIRSIQWFEIDFLANPERDVNAEIFKMITRFCAKTLIHLNINGRMKISITPQFEVLERFELFYGSLATFEPPRSLKYLRLTELTKNSYSKIDLQCLGKSFPNLKEAYFGDFTNLMPNLNWFVSFLKCNQQLEALTLYANEHFMPGTKHIVHNIGKYLSNLKRLHLDLFSVNIGDFKGLKNLKSLRIPHGYLRNQQIDSLIALDLPIEELEIRLKTADTYIAKRISHLKKIKTLNLNIQNVKGRSVLSLIENLPPLDNLNIR